VSKRLESTAHQLPLDANPAFEPLLIINPISLKFLGNLFSSHPATEVRVQELLKLEQQLTTTAY
jgi:heat shock protein HtpX